MFLPKIKMHLASTKGNLAMMFYDLATAMLEWNLSCCLRFVYGQILLYSQGLDHWEYTLQMDIPNGILLRQVLSALFRHQLILPCSMLKPQKFLNIWSIESMAYCNDQLSNINKNNLPTNTHSEQKLDENRFHHSLVPL